MKDETKRYFEENIVRGGGNVDFPPYTLLDESALTFLNDIFEARDISLPSTFIQWGESAFVDFSSVDDPEEDILTRHLGERRAEYLYVQWMLHSGVPSPVARLKRADVVQRASEIWNPVTDYLFLFDGSLSWFVLFAPDGTCFDLDREGYATFCRRSASH